MCVFVCVTVYVRVSVRVCVEKETRELGSSSPKAICRQSFLLLREVSLGSSQAFNRSGEAHHSPQGNRLLSESTD